MHGGGEAGVLREKTVAGMDRVGAARGGRVEELVDREIALARRGGADRDRLVGEPDVRRVDVGRRSRRRRSRMPMARHVRTMRTAISPRLAIRTLRTGGIGGRVYHAAPGLAHGGRRPTARCGVAGCQECQIGAGIASAAPRARRRARELAVASRLLGAWVVDLRRAHNDELEGLALRRLPLAMGVLAVFIGGALPIERHYYPGRVPAYLAVYGVELLVCAFAWLAARRWPHRTRAIATAWGALIGLCVAAYYPIVQADATLAMAALICLVTAIPATLPFGVRHQLLFGGACAGSFFGIFLWGLPMSLPWQYTFIAFLAVLTTSTIGAGTITRFRWEAFEREAILRHAHGQLRIALGRAEDTVELKTRLVANVSHELRTPLNVIVGYTDMLLDVGAGGAAVAEAAPRIRQYAVSLEALVSELLDLSRLTCGKLELHVVEVEVAPLLDEVARGARAMLRGKPVAVETDCRIARFATDPLRLQQVLNNLATNAAKFTDEGRITLAASADQDTVVFTVRDTGCGIPRAQHEAIFDAFEQGGSEAARKTSGIGLGLAIVRQLTDIMGGTVSVESAPGAGSAFTVRLPFATIDGEGRTDDAAPAWRRAG